MLFSGQPLSDGERKILEALDTAKNRSLLNKSLLSLPGMFPSNLAKFLRRLQERGLIERDIKTREYRILELGLEGLRRTDDMGISFTSKNAYFKELEPDNEMVAPRIVPVQATIYMNEEIAAAAKDVAREEGVKTTEARDRLLSSLAEQTAYAFEKMLLQRFYGLVDGWETYKIQQMSPADRTGYLRAYGLDGELLEELGAYHMNQKLPQGGPDLSIENVLDFEAALIVKVSRTGIMKDLQHTKDRLTHRILNDFSNPDIRTYPDKTMPVMAKAGLITQQELQAYQKAKRKRDRDRALTKLREDYFFKAWGKAPEKVHVVKIK
jgi:hypothetical protein